MVTPFKDDGSIDFVQTRKLAKALVASGSDGIVVAGTTGESPTVTWEEEHALFMAVKEAVGDKAKVIAGTGSNSTAQTIDLSRAVATLPIDGYLVVTPYYNKPTQEGLCRHYLAVADAVDRPVILYNVPGRTGVDMRPETVARVADHPGVIGIKEATGDLSRVATLRAGCGDEETG
jgi:4-hydroxy-tetrahydrodipicolinate synthase